VRWLALVLAPAVAAADTPRGTWTLEDTGGTTRIVRPQPLPHCDHLPDKLRHVVVTYDGGAQITSNTWKYVRRDDGRVEGDLREPIANTEVALNLWRDKAGVHGAVVWIEYDAHGTATCGDGVLLVGAVTP
jgi:hypothetical protein